MQIGTIRSMAENIEMSTGEREIKSMCRAIQVMTNNHTVPPEMDVSGFFFLLADIEINRLFERFAA